MEDAKKYINTMNEDIKNYQQKLKALQEKKNNIDEKLTNQYFCFVLAKNQASGVTEEIVFATAKIEFGKQG